MELKLLSVIIPAYNECDTIEEIIRRVGMVNIPKEIIVVDDSSTDGTRQILEAMDSDHVRVLYHDTNLGKGAAIRTALREVQGDVVIIQDADLEYDPVDYHAMLKLILEDRADVVYGSRFLGPHRAFLFWHYVGNKLLTLVTNILYNTILTDMETGYKMFRTEVLKGVQLRANRFDFEPEVTSKILKRGYRVFEVPISYAGREFHEGKKITWRDGLPALWTLIKYRLVD